MIFIILFLSIICVFALIYLTGVYYEYYWKSRGVLFYKKNRFFGPLWDFITTDKAMFEMYVKIYKKYSKEPAVGIGNLFLPGLYVIDPINVQHVIQTDFHSFNHRGVEINDEDILGQTILFIYGPKWKLMRQNLTPLFTAAKLKKMFYIVDKSARDFIEYLGQNPEKQKGKAFDTLNEFCCAAITATVFGIGSKSTFDSPLLRFIRQSIKPTTWEIVKFAISNLNPTLNKALGLKVFSANEKYFINAIKEVIRQREQDNVKKYDFVDMCVKLQKNGIMRDPDTGFEMEPSDEILAAQAFFFFIAGVEPTATSMLCTLIELGKNLEIQHKVQEEVDSVFEICNGKLTYDIIYEMEYLDKVLSEALRMYPPIGYLTRKCIKNTVLPVGNIKVNKGTHIIIPTFEYHHDPEYYTNPEDFDPERFSSDPKGGNDMTYLPFGKGGRICIGMRYARLQAKTGLVHILRNFNIKTNESKTGIKYNKEQVQVRPIGVDLEYIHRANNKNY